MITFNIRYFIWAALLFVIELLIFLYINDHFVRPYLGDYLVVILLYCLFKSFFKWSVIFTSTVVLLIAYLVEWTQHLKLIETLGWQHSRMVKAIIGSSFSWEDIVAYTLGIFSVLVIEKYYAG